MKKKIQNDIFDFQFLKNLPHYRCYYCGEKEKKRKITPLDHAMPHH